jgi:nitrile hydratase accessory protein
MTDNRVPINELPALPRDEEGPVFKEPWQAQAFALAVQLSERGYFSWPEWTVVLSQEIKAAQAGGDSDLGNTYYQHWLRALERLCTAKGLVGQTALKQRKTLWRRAYLNTRHGQPIELAAAWRPGEGADG